MLPTIQGVFTCVADPELRFTPGGDAVVNVRLVANGRRLNKQTQEWEDHGVVWLNGTAWRQVAENIAETFTKGDPIMVIGKLETREYDDREGNKRQSYDVHIDEVGASVRFATAKITRASRSGQQGGQQGGQQEAPANDPWATPQQGQQAPQQGAGAPANDPWATPPPSDEPPF